MGENMVFALLMTRKRDRSISLDAKGNTTSCYTHYAVNVMLPMPSCDTCLVISLTFSDVSK